MQPILIGAVAYDPRVVTIWELIRDFFRKRADAPLDYVLFSQYDAQVQALLSGVIEIAWNTPLAWLKVKRRTTGACQALAMRDTDLGFTTKLISRAGAGVRSLV